MYELKGTRMTTHRMAIIGYGGMAGFHCENIAKSFSGSIDLAGVYDVREEARAKARSKGLAVYDTPGDIYADSSVDLALVATPNDFHMPYAIDCLLAGKNVICEKPVTLNAEELTRVMATARETGRVFTVHQNRRWDRDYRIVRKIFEDGILSEPYTVESRVQGSRQSLHGWRGYKQNGGGMVLDWGVHLIDQALDWMPDKVVSVNATLHNVLAPEVDDNFTAVLRFESGLDYIVNIAMNCFIIQPRWHVSAKDGTAIVENWECDGKIVKLADSKNLDWAEDIVYTAAGPTRSMAPRPKSTTIEVPLPDVTTDLTEYYKNVLAAVEGKEELIVKPEQALRVMKVIDAIYESDREKRGVACLI